MLSIRVTSRETIKPSTPTSPHLRTMPLSVIDQLLAPQIYVQALLFFKGNGDAPAAKAAVLKESLSKSLTRFYPLAGRLCVNFLHAEAHVDCNDEGVEFYEATVEEGCLDAILSSPPMKELYKLMPMGGVNIQGGEPLLTVQLNAFTCGVIALGVCISHKVADATSLALFLNSWGEATRGVEPIASPPWFHAASVFPPQDICQELEIPKVDGQLPRRFVIRGSEIEKLREEAAYARAQPPTRVEAVITLLWQCIIRARQKPIQEKRIPVSLVIVNLRKRMVSELSDASFGNLLALAVVVDDMAVKGANRNRQASLEQLVRDSVSRVDGDHVRKQMIAFAAGENPMKDASVDVISFTSWCRVPIYQTDFGWGEPVWYCPLMRDLASFVLLADTKDGRGVELFVWLPEEETRRLAGDPELLEFVDPQSMSD